MDKNIKVSAFIRKRGVGKSDYTTRATIYFRVRGEGVDMKAASELTINPNHWSQEVQGYKPRTSLVHEQDKVDLHNHINGIKEAILKQYAPGADGEWLQRVIYCYHHPDAFKMRRKTTIDVKVIDWCNRYWKEKLSDKHQQSNIRSLVRRLECFEYFKRKIEHVPNATLLIDSINADDLREFQRFMLIEHEVMAEYPEMAEKFYKGHRKVKERSMNMVRSMMVYLRTIVNYYIHQGATTNNPFYQYEMPKCLLGTPIYISLEERNAVYNLDLSAEEDSELRRYRDMFVFQCNVGCRHYDLVHFTRDNITNDILEYMPHKTREKTGTVVRVPLSKQAKAILERTTPDPETGYLFPLHFNAKYNTAIREVCKRAGLTRRVSWLNPKTREEEKRPLYEVVASHTARRTFIGNLYNKVKDPALISSMSGHCDGSKAFARYRAIDDSIKRDLVELID